jgi:hypothetical protein
MHRLEGMIFEEFIEGRDYIDEQPSRQRRVPKVGRLLGIFKSLRGAGFCRIGINRFQLLPMMHKCYKT